MKSFDVMIQGKRWTVGFPAKLPKCVGEGAMGACNPPDWKHPRIRVRRDLGDRDRLETLVHELLHAEAWDYREDAVERIGCTIAEVLWLAGYRSGVSQAKPPHDP